MSRRTHRAARGEWGGRASTERVEGPGRPGVVRGCPATGHAESITRACGRGRESDRLIVARKRGNARGAKGPDFTHVSRQRRERPLERPSLHHGLGSRGLCGRGRPAGTCLPAALETGSQGEAGPSVSVLHPDGPHLPARRPGGGVAAGAGNQGRRVSMGHVGAIETGRAVWRRFSTTSRRRCGRGRIARSRCAASTFPNRMVGSGRWAFRRCGTASPKWRCCW